MFGYISWLLRVVARDSQLDADADDEGTEAGVRPNSTAALVVVDDDDDDDSLNR